MRTLCCMWTLCCGGERRSRFLARVCRASVLIPVLSSLCWSRKFLKSLVRKQPQELLLVIGTGVSAAVAPGIPALCSWRSCIEAVIEAAEQLEVLHPGDVAEFRRKVVKDRDLLVVAHDLIRKMSPVSFGGLECAWGSWGPYEAGRVRGVGLMSPRMLSSRHEIRRP